MIFFAPIRWLPLFRGSLTLGTLRHAPGTVAKLHHSIAVRIFLYSLIFLAACQIFCQEASSQEIPYTGEESPKTTVLSSKDFPEIESPKFISPRSAKSDQESEHINLNNRIWNQYQKDLQLQNKIRNIDEKRSRNMEKPQNLFYTYIVKSDPEKYLDTFNGLYARFQTGKGTFATINRISSPQAVKPGQRLIFPVSQGMYIPKKADSALEILLQKEYASQITDSTRIFEIDGTEFYFIPGATFSQTQTAFFHDTGMQLPLSKKVVTSQFGYRTSPITGKWKFHAGIDLAAPVGTEVYACKSGSVKSVAYSEIYGNYIIILHGKNTTSLYAHLSKTLVKPGQTVKTGQTIGLVGTTGASTGPHLHFEVRENGTPSDPGKKIRNF